jgi:predicted metal-dependent hydrolase
MEKTIKGIRFTFIKSPKTRRLVCRIDRFFATGKVTVPYGVALSYAEKFAERVVGNESKKGRINDLRDGGTFVIRGENLPLRIIPGEQAFSFMKENGAAHILAPGQYSYDELRAFILSCYLKDLYKRLDERVPYWEEKTGLHAESWRIKDMVSCWGNCNHRTKTIKFSLRLCMQSDEFLDMVIIHELGHILYPNHAADFQKYMDVFFPGHRAVKRREG